MLKFKPAVFAVENDYIIAVRVNEPCVMWVEVADESYYDQSNGILRSATTLHKMKLPASVLDGAGKYTVCYRRVIERKPYFSKLEEVERVEFSFRSVPKDEARAYHVADAHGIVESTVAAASTFAELHGGIDFLILNGDVIDHSGAVENFDAIYEIAARITGGCVPIVFSRGNHDTRGIYAENIADYTPTRDGFSYFTFRLGSIWGMVLDCGEDKLDDNEEYGHTICCRDFRMGETRYLESVIARADEEYNQEGVTKRIITCHVPFTERFEPPFNIEEDTYAYWTRLIGENIKPDVMICGHLHKMLLFKPGSEYDAYGQSFPVSVTSMCDYKKRYHAGAGYVFGNDGITVSCVDANGVIKEYKI